MQKEFQKGIPDSWMRKNEFQNTVSGNRTSKMHRPFGFQKPERSKIDNIKNKAIWKVSRKQKIRNGQ